MFNLDESHQFFIKNVRTKVDEVEYRSHNSKYYMMNLGQQLCVVYLQRDVSDLLFTTWKTLYFFFVVQREPKMREAKYA